MKIRQHLGKKNLIRLIVALIAIALLISIGIYASNILVPFSIISFFGIIMSPVEKLIFNTFKLPRIISVLLTLLLFAALIIGAFVLVFRELLNFIRSLPIWKKKEIIIPENKNVDKQLL